MAIKYTKEELIKNLQDVAIDIGHTPTAKEYVNHPLHLVHYSTIKKLFRKWSNALIVAKLPNVIARHDPYTDEEIIRNVKKIIERDNKFPSMTELKNDVQYPVSTNIIVRRFSNMFNLFKAAGYNSSEILANLKPRSISNEDLMIALYEIIISYPEECSIYDAIRKSGCKKDVFYRRFGTLQNIKNMLHIKYGLIFQDCKKDYSCIIKEIQEITKQNNGRIPRLKEYYKISKYKGIPQIITKFGGYNNLLKLAGLKINMTSKKFSKKQIVKDIKMMAKDLNRTPYYEEYIKLRKTNPRYYYCAGIDTIRRHFDSWNNLLKKAKLKFNRNRNIPKEQIIKAIQSVKRIVKHTPSIEEFFKNQDIVHSLNPIVTNFSTWNKALIAAGLKPSGRGHRCTDEQIISSIVCVAKYLKHNPTFNEYVKCPKKFISTRTIYKRFGSWNNALKAAGLK